MILYFLLIVRGFLFIPEVMIDLLNMVDDKSGRKCPMISEKHNAIIQKHADRLNSAIVYDRDFSYNYFGFKVNVI